MRRKIIPLFIGLSVIVPFVAFAQTDMSAFIQQLRQQIVALQQQLDTLQQQQSMETQSQSAASGEVSGDGSIVQAPSTFNRDLYYGMRNKPDVSRLQQFLMDQGLYMDEITGNFLQNTRKAVQAFQKAHGIVPPSGYFGPQTRAVANGILAEEGGRGGIIPPHYKLEESLSIEPSSATIKVGEMVRVKAMFTDPQPKCSSRPSLCKLYEVNASFTSSNPSIADIKVIVPTCAPPPPGFLQQCPHPISYVYGVSPGTATIKAVYIKDGGTFTATMQVTVVGTSNPLQPITVLSPNGGETWTKGTTQKITWKTNASKVPANVKVDIDLVQYQPPCTLLQPCPLLPIALYSIARGTENDGVFEWIGSVSDLVDPPIGKYLVRVSSSDNQGVLILDTSDAPFGIVSPTTAAPSLKVLYPNGGERFSSGMYVNIKWLASNFPTESKVYLELRPTGTDTRGVVTKIAVVSPSTDYYYWGIPNTIATGQYIIAVYKADSLGNVSPSETVKDVSDAPFYITGSTVGVSSPETELASVLTALQAQLGTLAAAVNALTR